MLFRPNTEVLRVEVTSNGMRIRNVIVTGNECSANARTGNTTPYSTSTPVIRERAYSRRAFASACRSVGWVGGWWRRRSGISVSNYNPRARERGNRLKLEHIVYTRRPLFYISPSLSRRTERDSSSRLRAIHRSSPSALLRVATCPSHHGNRFIIYPRLLMSDWISPVPELYPSPQLGFNAYRV